MEVPVAKQSGTPVPHCVDGPVAGPAGKAIVVIETPLVIIGQFAAVTVAVYVVLEVGLTTKGLVEPTVPTPSDQLYAVIEPP